MGGGALASADGMSLRERFSMVIVGGTVLENYLCGFGCGCGVRIAAVV